MTRITSIKEVQQRLSTLYFYKKLIKSPHYPLHLKRCKKHFSSKKSKKHKPYLLWLALCVPPKKLKKGYKFLPLRGRKGGRIYTNFIEVPMKITSYSYIIQILEQLKSLSNKQCSLKEKEKSFAYILGMMLSDTSKPEGYRFSNQCLVSLTRKYDWSLAIGNEVSSCFNKIGIKAHRIKDNTKLRPRAPNGEYRWISEKSPFITYLLETCMGLKPKQRTTYDKVSMDWLLSSPSHFLISFFQGLSDGDGCAHNFWRVELSCDPNQQIIVKLLKKLSIRSYIDTDSVNISHYESICKAYSLPIFLNAESRLKKLEKVTCMIKSRKFLKELSLDLKNKIILLKDEGLSAGQISEQLYDEMQIGVHPNAINSFYSNYSSNKS
tara:strand:- start:1428 stop:2564 length:1137 start_codon:yes stop_codon:yes gene_type:complete